MSNNRDAIDGWNVRAKNPQIIRVIAASWNLEILSIEDQGDGSYDIEVRGEADHIERMMHETE